MEQTDYRLAAIMYSDIAGFSRMMEMDEAGTLRLIEYHNSLIGDIVSRHHGTVIKTIGDAVLADFKNTVEALMSALEIQDRLYAHNKEGPGLPLLVRIGLHLGDIYFYENDALGEGINIAARLQSLARPGCICLSQDVYNIVLNKIEFHSEKLGKVSLKNITKEIHAYEIVSPNIEFDPNRHMPRPGYTPASYLGEGGTGTVLPLSPTATSLLPAAPAPIVPSKRDPDRDYSLEGSRAVLEEIRLSIIQDTKSLGRRMRVSEALGRYGYYGVEAEEVIARLAEAGFLLHDHRRRDGRMRARAAARRGLPTAAGCEGASAKDFEAYKDTVGKRGERIRKLFSGSLYTFLSLNAFLWFLNLTVGGKFPWAAIVSAATAIPLALNAVAALLSSKRKGELEDMPELDQAQLKDYRRLGRLRDFLAYDGAIGATVSILLGVVNGLTGISFPWFLIPAAALSFVFLSHFLVYRTMRPGLERRILSSLGMEGPWARLFSQGRERRADATGLGPYAPLFREAEAARDDILTQIRSGTAGPLDTALEPSLNEYVSQVRLLAQSAHEVDALIESIPLAELGKDKAILAAKESSSPSEALKAEYRKSIAEIEMQESSFAELKEEGEVLRLRLGSSVNQLKQLRLDIARAKVNPGEPGAGLDRLRKSTEELALYLEDLRGSCDEAKDDPFAALEAAEKARLP